jgi:hypothetical protein
VQGTGITRGGIPQPPLRFRPLGGPARLPPPRVGPPPSEPCRARLASYTTGTANGLAQNSDG